MKKLLFLLAAFLVTFAACSSVQQIVTGTKILRQTEDSAIIEAEGSTKARAILKAEDKACKMFGEFVQTKEPSCSEKISSNPNNGQI